MSPRSKFSQANINVIAALKSLNLRFFFLKNTISEYIEYILSRTLSSITNCLNYSTVSCVSEEER